MYWLADFDNDGIADIPVGRLPLRSVSDASLVISKIVNFSVANVPQAAMLIPAPLRSGPPASRWDFELRGVKAGPAAAYWRQRINVRTSASPAQATANIIDGLAQGRSVVNYSGHGNV